MRTLSRQDLLERGIAAVGEDVVVHPSVELSGCEHISIGSHVRIDCFCAITAGPGKVAIGDFVHIGVGACLFGTAGIGVGDFTSISARVAVYSTNDDYADGHLSGPTVPAAYRQVHAEPVVLEPHSLLGAGSVVLPGVRLQRGAAVGALSLVKRDIGPGEVAAGVPVRTVGRRDVRRLTELEAQARTATLSEAAHSGKR